MCQFFETYHGYSGCKLSEILPNGNSSRFSAFLQEMKHYVIADPPSQDTNAAAEDRQFHLVKYKTVILCPTANALKHLKESDRMCHDAEDIGHDKPGLVEQSGVTTVRAECPVCTAVAETIKTASNQTFFVS